MNYSDPHLSAVNHGVGCHQCFGKFFVAGIENHNLQFPICFFIIIFVDLGNERSMRETEETLFWDYLFYLIFDCLPMISVYFEN